MSESRIEVDCQARQGEIQALLEELAQRVREPQVVSSGEIEAPALEVRKRRFNGPARALIVYRRPCGPAVHGDNPRFFVTGFVQNAQVRQDPGGKQLRVRQLHYSKAFQPVWRRGT